MKTHKNLMISVNRKASNTSISILSRGLAFHVQVTTLFVFGGIYICEMANNETLPCGWWLAWLAQQSPKVIGDGILKFMQLKVLRAEICAVSRGGVVLVGKLVNNEYVIDSNL